MHWQTVVDDDAVYLIGEVEGGPVALKVTSSEHMPHDQLADLVVNYLNTPVEMLTAAASAVSQAIARANEARAQ